MTYVLRYETRVESNPTAYENTEHTRQVNIGWYGYRWKVLTRRPLQGEAVVAGGGVGVVADVEGLLPLVESFLKELHPYREDGGKTSRSHGDQTL